MSNLAVNTITNATGGNTAQINGMTPTAQSLQGFRNRIINGGMVIDQRNAGASINNSTLGVYSVDRWAIFGPTSARFSVQQNAGSVTPPSGFRNYLGATSLAATSLGSTDDYLVYQRIEGFNTADLGFGAAGASSVTLSFWVRSSLTGTFGGALQNAILDRSYVFSYAISAANTWEYKTVTIAGDTTGTWNTTNGLGIGVSFSLGSGTGKSTTAGSWVNGNLNGVTGGVSVVGTNGATWQITGVQLEAGSVATPFEQRDYGRELIMCQRYFCKTYSTNTSPATVTNTGSIYTVSVSTGTGTTAAGWDFPVEMRADPTVTFYNPISGATGTWRTGFGSDVAVGTGNPAGTRRVAIANTATMPGAAFAFWGHVIASIEL
jgi:hypothetical protein